MLTKCPTPGIWISYSLDLNPDEKAFALYRAGLEIGQRGADFEKCRLTKISKGYHKFDLSCDWTKTENSA
jgi:hypothetical protein